MSMALNNNNNKRQNPLQSRKVEGMEWRWSKQKEYAIVSVLLMMPSCPSFVTASPLGAWTINAKV